MNIIPRCPLALAFALLVAPVATAGAFEEPGGLSAEELLGAETVRGEHHSIASKVESDGLMNRYIISSKYQRIGAIGNDLTGERIQEQAAIAALRKIKMTDAYKDGLTHAAKAPLAVGKQMLTDPKGLVQAAPTAIGNAFGDLKNAVTSLGRKSGRGAGTSQSIKELIGYGKVKGRLAWRMGVDPYTSNMVLQTDLGDVAWVVFAGGATIDLAMTQTPIAASASMTVTEHLNAARGALWQIPPASVLNASAVVFRDAGLDENEARETAWHPVCSLTHQSYLASNIAELAGVEGRDELIRPAGDAEDEEGCRSAAGVARLAWLYHDKRRPLESVETVDDVVVLTDQSGARVLPLRADYAFWTPETARRVDALGAQGPRIVWVSGQVSPQTRAALAARNVSLEERVFLRHREELDIAEVLAPHRHDELEAEETHGEAIEPEKKKGMFGGLFGGGGDDEAAQ